MMKSMYWYRNYYAKVIFCARARNPETADEVIYAFIFKLTIMMGLLHN